MVDILHFQQLAIDEQGLEWNGSFDLTDKQGNLVTHSELNTYVLSVFERVKEEQRKKREAGLKRLRDKVTYKKVTGSVYLIGGLGASAMALMYLAKRLRPQGLKNRYEVLTNPLKVDNKSSFKGEIEAQLGKVKGDGSSLQKWRAKRKLKRLLPGVDLADLDKRQVNQLFDAYKSAMNKRGLSADTTFDGFKKLDSFAKFKKAEGFDTWSKGTRFLGFAGGLAFAIFGATRIANAVAMEQDGRQLAGVSKCPALNRRFKKLNQQKELLADAVEAISRTYATGEGR